jgi:hypothetical protein
MLRNLALLALLICGGGAACVPVPQSRAPEPSAPVFPVFAFFEGRSEGRATLKIATRAREAVRVESFGRVAGGTLTLDQRIFEGDKPPRTRRWLMRETAPGRYAGTASDAAGPVTGEASPGRLHLAFRMKGGLAAEQWLTLARDGRSAHNVLTARKFGIVVAALEETIRKL